MKASALACSETHTLGSFETDKLDQKHYLNLAWEYIFGENVHLIDSKSL